MKKEGKLKLNVIDSATERGGNRLYRQEKTLKKGP